MYSFGLIMWGLFTRQIPYADVKPFFKIPLVVASGERPIIPDNCPKEWADLMRGCWHNDPEKRPKFKKIVKKLEVCHRNRILDELDRTEAAAFSAKGKYSPFQESISHALHTVRIPLDDLEIGQVIGTGALCKTYKALWKSKSKQVQLKMYLYTDLLPDEVNDFTRELWLTR